MKIYLVGGAVRDELLGLPVKERDWVIVGATPEELLALGYQPVGKEFPVFLHPETHEEYALARTERKNGKGYKGFVFYTDPTISLEEDLKRRDLSINAIAKDSEGTLIDPYHGQDDLKKKCLRHVSPAFAEDPVRILRVARFAATLPEFTVDPLTNNFMTLMVQNGEVEALTPERVWQEMSRALVAAQPVRFFEVLNNCGALKILFPSLKHHRVTITIDYFNGEQRFAVLLHELSCDEITYFCKHYKVPTGFSDLALLTKQLSTDYQALDTKNPRAILSLIKRGDALRRPERFIQVVQVLAHYSSIDHLPLLEKIIPLLKNIDTQVLQEKNLKNAEFAAALEQLQLKVIVNLLKTQSL